MGEKIEQFELPVCTIFRPNVIEGQLCYQVDIDKVTDQVDVDKISEYGLILLLDYNDELNPKIQEDTSKLDVLSNLHGMQNLNGDSSGATIHIETLGNKQ